MHLTPYPSAIVCALAFLFACGGDDSGDDDAAETAADDETPASDDFAPGDEGTTDSNSAGSNSAGSNSAGSDSAGSDSAGSEDDTAADSSGATADDGQSGCVEAGGACGPADYCSTWICVCNSGATEFMTIGGCESGVCSTDGDEVCGAICKPSGGITSATDEGCA